MTAMVPALVATGLAVHITLNVVVFLRLNYEFSVRSVFDLVGILAGIYAADFISGFVHWLGDVDIPWKNRYLKRFHELSQEHHRHPSEILGKNYFKIKGNIGFLYAPPLILALILAPVKGMSPFVFALVGIGNLMLLVHSIHKWCHQKTRNRVIALLQSTGIIVAPEYHLQHHIPPYAKNYAAVNGWSDFLFRVTVLKWSGLSKKTGTPSI